MTREEKLRKVLDKVLWTHNASDDNKNILVEAIIKALEQEPCEDAVSRKAVHDMLENLPVTVENKWFNWLQKACMRLAELPPVTPQEPFINKPCISEKVCEHDKQRVLDKIRAEIEETYMNITYQENKDRKATWGLRKALRIIDKYKAESEG